MRVKPSRVTTPSFTLASIWYGIVAKLATITWLAVMLPVIKV